MIVLFWVPSAGTDPDNPDNAYNADTPASALSLTFTVNITATQTPAESDSFGSGYDNIDVWDGSSDADIPQDEAGDYLPRTAEHLAALRDMINSGTMDYEAHPEVILEADMDLAGIPWTPIGQSTGRAFAGVLDGNGHTVKNVVVNSSNPFGYTGFINYVKDATVENLTLENVTVTNTESYAGGAIGGVGGDSVISGITVSGYVSGDKVGGIVGRVTNDDALHSVTDPPYTDVTIKDCVNKATVEATTANSGKAAGIVAQVEFVNKFTVENCVNEGAIISAGEGEEAVVGGIVGYVMRANHTEIRDCSNSGSITVTGREITKCNVGGILSTGHQGDFYLYRVHNTGTISVTPVGTAGGSVSLDVGGICGSTSQKMDIVESSNSADITASAGFTRSPGVNVGGILGDTTGDQTVSRCTASGTYTATKSLSSGSVAYAGRIAGAIGKSSHLTVSGCTYDDRYPVVGREGVGTVTVEP